MTESCNFSKSRVIHQFCQWRLAKMTEYWLIPEKQRTDKGKFFKIFQRYRLFEKLPVLLQREKFVDEFPGIGQEVMIIVLVSAKNIITFIKACFQNFTRKKIIKLEFCQFDFIFMKIFYSKLKAFTTTFNQVFLNFCKNMSWKYCFTEY